MLFHTPWHVYKQYRWLMIGGLVVLVISWLGYHIARPSYTLIVNGRPYTTQTYHTQITHVLQSAEFEFIDADIIIPPRQATLTTGESLEITLARPIIIQVDGQTIDGFTHKTTITDIVNQFEILLTPHDSLTLNNRPVSIEAPLPLDDTHLPDQLSDIKRATPIQLTIKRAIPIVVQDGPLQQLIYTHQSTIGALLQAHDFHLFAEDHVVPHRNQVVQAGKRVLIQRATPITISLNEQTLLYRTHHHTVGEALAEQGITLMGQDFSRPGVSQPITPYMTIEVVRVEETMTIVDVKTPFETEWIASDDLELDQYAVLEPGQYGIIKNRIRTRYENGVEVKRHIEDEWFEQSAKTRHVAYGTTIMIRTLQTKDGEIEYWRKLSMLTTAYSAATSGKSVDHPNYGKTRTGKQAGYGIVAVDPRVIPLNTQLYIPNYGLATADDTGGGVLGNHIDLGFDEDDPPNIYGWQDIYILLPIPPKHEIRYVLPEWPQKVE